MASLSAKAGRYGKSEDYVIIEANSVANIATNTSTVTVRVYLKHMYMEISGRTGSVVIDGKSFSFKTGAISAEHTKWLVATKTKEVIHNDNGTKEIVISASFPYDRNSKTYGWIGTAKVSSKFTLDTIPRSSEIVNQTASVVANDMNKWSLTMAKHADAFRHTATLTFGDLTYTTDVFDTSVEYAIPKDWLGKIPTATKGTANVSIQTYSDESCNTTIGDPVTTTFEVVVPSDAAPTLNSGWAVANPDNFGTAAEGMNVYVQGYSKAKVTFDENQVKRKYGATGVTFKVEWDGTSSSDTTKLLTKSGEQKLRCIATDSRGLQSVEDIPITVHPYSKPTLSNIAVYRSNSSGTATEDGTFIYFRAKCTFSECGGANSFAITAKYKPTTGTVWNSETLNDNVGKACGGGALLPTTSYDAQIIVVDGLGNSATYTTKIATASVGLHLRKRGKGGGLGKYGQTDGNLECVWNIVGEENIIAQKTLKGASAEITGSITGGSVKGSTIESTGAVTGASIAATGAVTGASATISGTGTFGSVKANGEVSGATGKFAGGVKGAQDYRMDIVAHTELLANYIPSDGRFAASDIENDSTNGSTEVPRISRVGPLVFLDGAVNCKAAISAGEADLLVATLPEWARPKTNVHCVHQSSGTRFFWMFVRPNGVVMITRIRNENGAASCSANSFFNLTARWIAADAF